MKVTLTDLPLKIQQQLPMSIRSYKNIYDVDELPPRERDIIRDYLTKVVDVAYGRVFDVKPKISKYADLQTLETVKDTIGEYLRNYFFTAPTDYPFDPLFGCKLKYYIQTRDTALRKTLISEEVNKVVGVLATDLKIPIIVESVTISPQNNIVSTSYDISISLIVNGENHIKLEMEELY